MNLFDVLCRYVDGEFWLGLNDPDVRSVFKWSDGSYPMYTAWAPDYPKTL